MYTFARDGKSFVFGDWFGMTRVTFPKRVKMDRKEQGSALYSFMSLSDAGDVLYTTRLTWEKATLWSFPSMKPIERFDRFRKTRATLHPSGAKLVFCNGFTLTFEDYPSGATTEVDLSPTSEGGGGGWKTVPNPLVFGEEGRFAHLHDGLLTEGNVNGDAMTVTARRAIEGEGYAQAFVTRAGVHVIVSSACRSVVHLASGEVVEVDSKMPAQISGDWLVYQPEDERVVRRALSTGEETEYALEGDDAGWAHLFVGEDRVLALPWHREDVLDLTNDVRIPRKLPAGELDVRRAVVEHVTPYLKAATHYGVVLDWGDISLESKYTRVCGTAMVAAEGSHEAQFITQTLYNNWMNRSYATWRGSSHGMHGSGGSPSGDFADDDARAMLRVMIDSGIPRDQIRRQLGVKVGGSGISDEVIAWFDDEFGA